MKREHVRQHFAWADGMTAEHMDLTRAALRGVGPAKSAPPFDFEAILQHLHLHGDLRAERGQPAYPMYAVVVGVLVDATGSRVGRPYGSGRSPFQRRVRRRVRNSSVVYPDF